MPANKCSQSIPERVGTNKLAVQNTVSLCKTEPINPKVSPNHKYCHCCCKIILNMNDKNVEQFATGSDAIINTVIM